MKETWSAMRKIIAPIMFVALATTGLTVAGSTAAHAVADNEWSVKNTNFSSGEAAGWLAQYYGANARYLKINAVAGGSKTITYRVEHNGVAAEAGTTVNFVAGKAWSDSKAVVTVNGQTTSGAECWCGNDQAATSAVTDSSGNVSFTLDGSAAVSGKSTQIYAWVANKGNTAGEWSKTADTADVIDINYVASSTKTAGDYRVRSTNTGTTQTSVGWTQYYSPDMRHFTQTLVSGATSNRTWKVTDNVGNPAAGVTVTMVAGKAYSGSNAAGTIAGTSFSGESNTTATAVSDVNGDVSFTLTNTSGTATQIAAWVNPNVNDDNYISGDSFDIVDLTYSAESSGGSSIACAGGADQACPPNSALTFANGSTSVSVTDGAFTSTGSSLSVTVTSPAGASDAGKQGTLDWFDESGVTLSQGVTNSLETPWAAGGCYPDGAGQCQYKLGSDGTATFTIGVSGSGSAKFHSVGVAWASDVLTGTFSGGGSGGGGSTPTPAPAVFLNFASNDDLGKLVGAFEGASGAIVSGHYEFTATGNPWSGMDVFIPSQNKVLTNAANSVITFDYTNPNSSAESVMLKLYGTGAPDAFIGLTAEPGLNHLSADFSTVIADAGTGKHGLWSSTATYKGLALFPGFGGDVGMANTARSGQVYQIDNLSINGGTSADVYTEPVDSSAVVKSIKLDSSDYTAALAATGSGWWNEGNGSKSVLKYVGQGTTLTLHYTVKDADGNPVSGANVVLDATGANSDYTGDLQKTTDADGKVTFTLVNGTSNSNVEWARPDLSVWSDSETNNREAVFIPYISGTRSTQCYSKANATSCDRDRVWAHAISTATYTVPAVTNVRLTLGDTNGVTDHSDWWTDKPSNRSMVKMVSAGSTVVFNYLATMGGAPVGAGRTVTLVPDGGAGGTFTGSLTATTNASGVATFVLTNTNTTGEDRPVSPSNMNYWDGSRSGFGAEVSKNFNVTINDAPAGVAYDRLWIHVVKQATSQAVPLAPYQVQAKRTASKKITVSWNPATVDGSANTGYEVSVRAGTSAAIVVNVGANVRSTEITVPSATLAYVASVKAKNSVGSSAVTSASGSIVAGSTAAAAPLAPALAILPTLGVDAFWLGFSPNITTTGATITGYQYSLNNGTWKDATYDPAKPGNILFVYGLTPNTAYTVKLRAVNSVGIGAASASKTVTTAKAPKAPKLNTVSFANGTLSVNWDAVLPADSGGSAITKYQYRTSSAGAWVDVPTNKVTLSASKTNMTMALSSQSATARVIAVRAWNGLPSEASTSLSISAPLAVPSFAAVAGANKVVVTIDPITATNNGNSPATYEYQVNDGTWTAGAVSTAINVSGTAGTAVSVKVRAVNAIGAGTASAAKSATPFGAPTAAPAFTVTSGTGGTSSNSKVVVKITALPVGSNGGSAVNGYAYSINGGTTWTALTTSAATAASGVAITGKAKGSSVSVIVRAVNAAGNGVSSSPKAANAG